MVRCIMWIDGTLGRENMRYRSTVLTSPVGLRAPQLPTHNVSNHNNVMLHYRSYFKKHSSTTNIETLSLFLKVKQVKTCLVDVFL